MPSQVRQEGMWQSVHLPPHWPSSAWVGGDLTEQESGVGASLGVFAAGQGMKTSCLRDGIG